MTVERKASNSKAAMSAFSDVHKLPEAQEVYGAKAGLQIDRPSVPLPLAEVSQSRPEVSQPVSEEATSGDLVTPATGVDTADRMFDRPVQLRPGRCMTCNKKVILEKDGSIL
jgi:hypothetical protein